MTYIRKKQLQIKTKLTNRKIQSKTNTIEYLIKTNLISYQIILLNTKINKINK